MTTEPTGAREDEGTGTLRAWAKALADVNINPEMANQAISRIESLQRDLATARELADDWKNQYFDRQNAIEELFTENATLRARIAELEGDAKDARAAAIEECAKICDEDAFNSACSEDIQIAEDLAKAIRALTPPSAGAV